MALTWWPPCGSEEGNERRGMRGGGVVREVERERKGI